MVEKDRIEDRKERTSIQAAGNSKVGEDVSCKRNGMGIEKAKGKSIILRKSEEEDNVGPSLEKRKLNKNVEYSENSNEGMSESTCFKNQPLIGK